MNNQNNNGVATVTQEEIVTSLVLEGDLSKMTPPQKVDYYNRFCEVLGLSPLTQPFEIINLKGKLRLYATKSCTEQLRRINGVSVTDLTVHVANDIYTVVAKGMDKTGRTDAATGAVPIKGLSGENLANAIMKAETKAKRRLTLSLSGLGILDESELDGAKAGAAVEGQPKAQTNTSTTPNAPAQDALATEEDYNAIYAILNQFLSLGVTQLNTNPPISIQAIGQKVQADQSEGRIMEKSTAEKYIKDLNAYLAPYLNQQPTQ